MKQFPFFIFLLCVGILSGSCDECREGFRTELIRIPRESWFPPVEALLNTTSIRLNNFTPNRNEFDGRQAFAFFRRGDSRMTLLGEARPISELDNEALLRQPPYTIYVNDMNSREVSTRISASEVVLQIPMEGDGTEIVSDCIDNVICGDPPFGLGKPTVQIDNAIITFMIRPIVDETGRITFQGRADFSANTQINLCERNFFAFLCDMFGINGGVINDRIENELSNIINNADLRNQFSERIMPLVTPLIGEGERLSGVSLLDTGELWLFKLVPCS